MGEVYRARDERLERDVALKVLPPGAVSDEGARRRFRREALALSRLNHPNIATVLDFDRQDDLDFLVMEYVAGEGVAEKVRGGLLAEREIARLGLELAEGIASAHGQGVIHRDLKPGNLRLMPDGRLKILDFGLAQLLESAGAERAGVTETASATGAGVAVGTLPYMAPERLRGERADARSDIWAVGLVLYELATGRRAFPEGDSAQLITAILHEAPSPPSGLNRPISPALESIIVKCLEKDPENRYQSAKELAVDLRRLGATSHAAGLRSAGHARSRPWVVACVAGLAVTLAASLFALNVGGLRHRLLGGARAAQVRSLAVLPLVNLSGDQDQEYFADGMTEELTTTIAQIGALKVISRTSSMKYKGTKKGLPEIGRELGVDAVVEGSVLRAGNRVRVTAQLVRASTDEHLWARSYERDLRDVLALQSDVARAVASEIGAKLRPEPAGRGATARPVDPAAYDAYLSGRHYLRSQGESNVRKAIGQFEESIRIDSTYAPAWAGIADGWYRLSTVYISPRGAMPKSRAAAMRALDLDSELAEAHAALGAVLSFYDWEWGAGERSLRRAIELNPNSPTGHLYLSYLLQSTGRLDEAIVEGQTSAELDPLSSGVARNVPQIHYFAGRYETAIMGFQRLIEKDPADFVFHFGLGNCYVALGRLADGVAEFRKAAALPGAYSWTIACLCYGLGVWGKPEEARRALEELRRRSQESYVQASAFAIAYVGLGDRDRAFEWLERGYEQRDENLTYLNVSPIWEPLRSDPRFRELLRRMRLAA